MMSVFLKNILETVIISGYLEKSEGYVLSRFIWLYCFNQPNDAKNIRR